MSDRDTAWIATIIGGGRCSLHEWEIAACRGIWELLPRGADATELPDLAIYVPGSFGRTFSMYLNASLIDIFTAAKQIAPPTADDQDRLSLAADLLGEAYEHLERDRPDIDPSDTLPGMIVKAREKADAINRRGRGKVTEPAKHKAAAWAFELVSVFAFREPKPDEYRKFARALFRLATEIKPPTMAHQCRTYRAAISRNRATDIRPDDRFQRAHAWASDDAPVKEWAEPPSEP
jgi:hypothetical protein